MMDRAVKVLLCSVFLFCLQDANADYTNSTINKARMISDDFRLFQKTGKRVSRRDGRLILFDTKNNNIEVGLEFAVPFLSIPVKRSVDTVKSWTSFVSNPTMNINTGAIALTGAVLVGGLVTTYLWKSAMGDQVQFGNSPVHFPFSRKNDQFDEENPLNQIMEKVGKMFHKYDIDVTTCVQKMICVTVRNAVENVANGNGTSTEKIFDGLTSTWFLRRLTAGTAVSDAILAGQRMTDCEKKFMQCNLKSKNLHQMFDLMLRSINYH